MFGPTRFSDYYADEIKRLFIGSLLISTLIFSSVQISAQNLKERDASSSKIKTHPGEIKTGSVEVKSVPSQPVIVETAELRDSAAKKAIFSALLSLSWPLVLPVMAETSLSADEIVSNFLNQKQAIKVTEEEWQAVVSQDEETLVRDPGNSNVKVRLLFARGQIAYLRGNIVAALTAFNEAIEMMPDSLLGYVGAGNVYLNNHLIPETIESFEHVIRIDPKMAVAYKTLGDAYSYSQRHEDAITMYQRARQLGYFGAELNNSLEKNQAQLLMSEHHWQQALSKLYYLAESSPAVDIYLMLGECYEELNQKISAVQAYTKATALDRQSAVAHFRLGNILFQKHEYRAAADAIERAVTLDPWGIKINLQQARKRRQEAVSKLLM